MPVVTDELSVQVAKHVSDLGNQHNNGPHQDRVSGNPSALCLALWAKNRIRLGGRCVWERGGGGGRGRGGWVGGLVRRDVPNRD